MPAACTARRISCGPAVGTGSVWSVSTEGGPNSSIAAARIVFGTVCRRWVGSLCVVVAIVHLDGYGSYDAWRNPDAQADESRPPGVDRLTARRGASSRGQDRVE